MCVNFLAHVNFLTHADIAKINVYHRYRGNQSSDSQVHIKNPEAHSDNLKPTKNSKTHQAGPFKNSFHQKKNPN